MNQRHGAASRPSSLRDLVRRAHLGPMAMALAGALLLLAGLVALRVHLESNLQLMARSVGYTVEAALVFKDQEDARETLSHMLAHEGVAHAVVRDAQGDMFAQWQGSATSLRARMGQTLARTALLVPVVEPIRYHGRPVGTVELLGDGQALVGFLCTGLAVLLGCMVVSGAVGLLLARRMLRDMVAPLQALAQVACRAARACHRPACRLRESWPSCARWATTSTLCSMSWSIARRCCGRRMPSCSSLRCTTA